MADVPILPTTPTDQLDGVLDASLKEKGIDPSMINNLLDMPRQAFVAPAPIPAISQPQPLPSGAEDVLDARLKSFGVDLSKLKFAEPVNPEAERAAQKAKRAIEAEQWDQEVGGVSGTALGRAIGRGTASTLIEAPFSFLETLAALGPSKSPMVAGVKNWAKQNADYWAGLTQAIPKEIEDIRDINSPGDLGTYAVENIGEAIPMLASMLIPGAITGRMAMEAALAKNALALARAKNLQALAVVAPAFVMATGANFRSIRDTVGKEAPVPALITGLASGLLMHLVPLHVTNKIFEAMSDPARKLLWSNLLGSVVKNAAQEAGSFGLTMGAQDFLSLAANKMADSTYKIVTPDNMWRMLNAAASGVVSGAGLGTFSAVMQTAASQGNKIPVDVAPLVQQAMQQDQQRVINVAKARDELAAAQRAGLDQLAVQDNQPAVVTFTDITGVERSVETGNPKMFAQTLIDQGMTNIGVRKAGEAQVTPLVADPSLNQRASQDALLPGTMSGKPSVPTLPAIPSKPAEAQFGDVLQSKTGKLYWADSDGQWYPITKDGVRTTVPAASPDELMGGKKVGQGATTAAKIGEWQDVVRGQAKPTIPEKPSVSVTAPDLPLKPATPETVPVAAAPAVSAPAEFSVPITRPAAPAAAPAPVAAPTQAAAPTPAVPAVRSLRQPKAKPGMLKRLSLGVNEFMKNVREAISMQAFNAGELEAELSKSVDQANSNRKPLMNVARETLDRQFTAFNMPRVLRALMPLLAGARYFDPKRVDEVTSRNPNATLVDFMGDQPVNSKSLIQGPVGAGYKDKLHESVSRGLPREATAVNLTSAHSDLEGRIMDATEGLALPAHGGKFTKLAKQAIVIALDKIYGDGQWIMKQADGAAGEGIFVKSQLMGRKAVPAGSYLVERYDAGLGSAEAQHYRVHGIVRNGKLEIIPYATAHRTSTQPFVFRTEGVKRVESVAQAAADKMTNLHNGDVFGFDVVFRPDNTADVVEVNPTIVQKGKGTEGVSYGRSLFISGPLFQMAVIAHLRGEVPAFVEMARILARHQVATPLSGPRLEQAVSEVRNMFLSAQDAAAFTKKMVDHFGVWASDYTEAMWHAISENGGKITAGVQDFLSRALAWKEVAAQDQEKKKKPAAEPATTAAQSAPAPAQPVPAAPSGQSAAEARAVILGNQDFQHALQEIARSPELMRYRVESALSHGEITQGNIARALGIALPANYREIYNPQNGAVYGL